MIRSSSARVVKRARRRSFAAGGFAAHPEVEVENLSDALARYLEGRGNVAQRRALHDPQAQHLKVTVARRRDPCRARARR
jgi:hypothetical protein